jgi:hypothetical protein
MKNIIIFFMLAALVLPVSAVSKGKIDVPLRFDRYYDLAEVEEALRALNSAYPELTKLDVVGKSEEGREIFALTINNPKTGNELENLVFMLMEIFTETKFRLAKFVYIMQICC